MPETSSKGVLCVFACRWCSLLGAERAGRERLPLPAGIRLMPVSCAGSVSADSVIQAFVNGAAGVAVLGCHLGGCRHNDANRDAHVRLDVLADLLESVGIDRRRLLLSWGAAHEARQYADLMRDFTAQLDALPPLPPVEPAAPAEKVAPPADATAAGEDVSPDQDASLRQKAATALENGRAVLALNRTPAGLIPDLFTREDELATMTAGPRYPIARLAGHLLRDRQVGSLQAGGDHLPLRQAALEMEVTGLSIACRECDARALRQQAALRQFSADMLDILPVECSEQQREACACDQPGQRGEAAPAPTQAAGDAAPLWERLTFWREQFSRCVQCHWCRAACPVCVCPTCSLDESALLPAGMMPPSPLGYHLARAMHVADACVQCGACQDACPQGLPLLELHRAVARGLRRFDYAAGQGEPSPMRNERRRAGARPQWSDGLKGGTIA